MTTDAASSSPHLIVLTELYGNKPVTLNPMQAFLAPHLYLMTLIWGAIACTAFLLAIRHVVLEIRAERRKKK